MSNTQLHGGDLDIISRQYNIPKKDIINFAGNVNPLGLPKEVTKAISYNLDAIYNYPDVNYSLLRKAISEYTKADFDSIIVGNGSTELISGYIKALSPRVSIIVSPAYSEYQRNIELTGGEIKLFPLKESEGFVLNLKELRELIKLTKNLELLVICNPNNPTGTFVEAESLRELLTLLKEKNAYLMVDETYIEFADNVDEISAMPLTGEFDNLFVIRGTSKFFACPGLRLGYSACTSEKLRNKVLSTKDPWSVNSYAEVAGCTMFTTRGFQEKTRELNINERAKIKAELSTWKNIRLYDSQANFFLFKILRDDITAAMVFEALIKKKMLIRDCTSFPYLEDGHYIRFCIQMPEQNKVLLQELKNIIEK